MLSSTDFSNSVKTFGDKLFNVEMFIAEMYYFLGLSLKKVGSTALNMTQKLS